MVAALRVVHPIARTYINLQFRDAVSQVPKRARFAMDEPVDAHQDACPTCQILQGIDPVAVLVSLLNAHAAIVAHELQTVRRVADVSDVGRDVQSTKNCSGNWASLQKLATNSS